MSDSLNIPRQISSQYYSNLKSYTSRTLMLFDFFKQQTSNNQQSKNHDTQSKLTNNHNKKQQNKINNNQASSSFIRKTSLSKDHTEVDSIRQEKLKYTEKVINIVQPLAQRQNTYPSKLNSKIQSHNRKVMKKQTASNYNPQNKNYSQSQHPFQMRQMDHGEMTENNMIDSGKRRAAKYEQKQEIQKLIYQYSNTNSTQQLTSSEFEELIQDVYQSMCGVNSNLNREQMKTIMLLVDTDRNGIISKQQLSRIVVDNKYK